MARVALSAEHLTVIFGFIVVAAETVGHRAPAQHRALGMLGFPGLRYLPRRARGESRSDIP